MNNKQKKAGVVAIAIGIFMALMGVSNLGDSPLLGLTMIIPGLAIASVYLYRLVK